jgi:hypothetical protein
VRNLNFGNVVSGLYAPVLAKHLEDRYRTSLQPARNLELSANPIFQGPALNTYDLDGPLREDFRHT